MSSDKLTRREERELYKRRKQMQSIGIMIIGVLIIVAGVVLVTLIRPGLAAPPERDYQMVDRNAIGDPNAPVVIEEFFSFACIHCRNFALGTQYLLIQDYVYTGQVYYISHAFNNPEDAFGIAAQAAYCAADQGQYWPMHDMIFANFNSAGYTTRELAKMAEEIGLDLDQYSACMDAGTHIETIQNEAIRGAEAGVTGTPSFLINGEFSISGNREYSFFQQQLDLALLNAGN